MAAAPPYGPFQFIAVRATLAAANGAPVPGADNGYFAKQVVKATVGLDVEEGERKTLKRGDDSVCRTSKGKTTILGASLAIELCNLDAALIALTTGALLISEGSTPMGYEVLAPDDAAPDGVIFEGWSKAWDSDRQATPTVLGNDVGYFHFVFPFWEPQLGEIVLDTEHNSIPVSGNSSKNENITINGPYDDWPDWVVDHGGITRPYGVFLDDALPDLDDGPLTVTALAS